MPGLKDPNAESFLVSKDILSLVDRKLTREEWRGWTERQRKLAIDWAAASLYRASDHLVRVPREPVHVKRLKRLTND